MSRSYRKPWVTDGYKGSDRRQFFKRYSNKKIRRTEEIADGKAFKKVIDPWDISDYRWYESLKSMSKWSLQPWKYNRK
ncbi:MAG: hypothetical protein PHF86_11655 [Candidatus Nanoarchaeia archaeon]|nr:hypothetical protein [Candidatus Nanoarchaeia archaeon]